MLVTGGLQARQGPASRLVADALQARDLEPKAGKLLQAYRAAGIAAAARGAGRRRRRLGQAGACGRAGAAGVAARLPARNGWSILPAGRAAAPTRCVRRSAARPRASYVYVATKSKPEGRELEQA